MIYLMCQKDGYISMYRSPISAVSGRTVKVCMHVRTYVCACVCVCVCVCMCDDV